MQHNHVLYLWLALFKKSWNFTLALLTFLKYQALARLRRTRAPVPCTGCTGGRTGTACQWRTALICFSNYKILIILVEDMSWTKRWTCEPCQKASQKRENSYQWLKSKLFKKWKLSKNIEKKLIKFNILNILFTLINLLLRKSGRFWFSRRIRCWN